jgi:ABC-type nitrate/sulfonate/bicarbonate transport system substrate-binding protein
MRKWITTFLSVVAIGSALANTTERPFPEPHPNPTSTLRVIGFAGGFNLPIWVAQRQGFFTAEKLDVKLDFTPGSTWQITHLLAGNYDIAMTAYDNVVAYREGQAEAYIPPNVPIDLVSVLHSDNAFLSISAQPDIKSFTDLKGKTVTVDAMTTGFAFVLREILQRKGVAESDVSFERAGGVSSRFRAMQTNPKHAATTQMTPFELLGEARGFNTLTRVDDVLGSYMGMTAAVRQSWAQNNRSKVVGFARAYQKAIDWLFDPANRAEAEAILVANVQGMSPALATKAYELYVGKEAGFRRSIRFDAQAAKTVIDLRSKFGRPEKRLTNPAAYFDASFLAEAGIK